MLELFSLSLSLWWGKMKMVDAAEEGLTWPVALKGSLSEQEGHPSLFHLLHQVSFRQTEPKPRQQSCARGGTGEGDFSY